MSTTRTHINLLFVLLIALVSGCGEKVPTVDEAPFREAVGEYLRVNDMAMAIKTIKEGPTTEGETAQMVASMTHKELGGPSVTWTFYFERNPSGGWTVARHED